MMMDHSKNLAVLPFDPLARAAVIDAAYAASDEACARWSAFYGMPPSLAQESVMLDQSMRSVLAVLDVRASSTLADLAATLNALKPRADFLPANLLTVRSDEHE